MICSYVKRAFFIVCLLWTNLTSNRGHFWGQSHCPQVFNQMQVSVGLFGTGDFWIIFPWRVGRAHHFAQFRWR